MKCTIAVCLGLLPLATSAAAQSPVAIVEEIQGKVTGAEFMDYVTPKSVIKISNDGSVVISYLNSCRRETISGAGTVIIGTDESSVHLAEVKAEKTNCDSRQLNATTRETREAAAAVVRSANSTAPAAAPPLMLYGASPFIEAKGRGKLVVERLDVRGERVQIDLEGRQFKGRFYDFAGSGRALTPGGLYAASFGPSKVVFRIDPQAKPGATAIVGRLVRME
jgi:hypothetical protein